MRAAIYLRVSTDKQADVGTGLIEQTEGCRAYCEGHGWEVAEVYADEVSGTLEHRPAMDRLLADCQGGKVDVVVLHELSRLARSTRIGLNRLHEFAEAGAAVAIVKGNIDTTTPAGKAQQGMMLLFAELDRALIVEHTSAGLRQRVRQGRWPGGPAPFGYRLAKGDGGTTVEPDPVEAETLREATSLVVDHGLTTWEAAAALNAAGRGPRRAPKWDHVNLRRVLSDRRYSGTWTYSTKAHGVLTLELPRLVDPDRLAVLHARLAATSSGPKPKQAYYLLTRGLLVSACGRTYHGVSRHERGYRQYRCAGAKPEAFDRCSCPRLRADEVEDLVWTLVCGFLRDPERLARLADDYLGLTEGDDPGEVTERLTGATKALAKADADLAKAATTFLQAGLDGKAIEASLTELRAERDSLAATVEALVARIDQAGAADAARETLEELAARADAELTAMDDRERRAVLELLQVRVAVKGWRGCPHCGGSGKVPGGPGGGSCPVCHQIGRTPMLEVEGFVRPAAVAAHLGEPSVGVLRPSTCSRP